jgi:hypothetical protein
MNLLINISQIAIITGDNPYQSKRDYLIDFWKKYDKNDYEEYVNRTKFIKENDKDKINNISKKNNIDIKKELKDCLETKDLTELNKKKSIIYDKLNDLSKDEKKEITKSIENITNTTFGTTNENDITKLYENITSQNFIKDDIYKKKKIITNNLFSIYIGGKIDGISEDKKTIIEIKNRVKCLFYKLREYEKVQIISYMYLFNVKNGNLVEALKKKDNTNINIINVEYEDIYMNNIIEKLNLFGYYFLNFFNNETKKIELLQNNNEITEYV